MSHLRHKSDYRRNLPHLQPAGATFFVTCRLAGTLPQEVIASLAEETLQAERTLLAPATAAEHPALLRRLRKQAFARLDTLLDVARSGPTWLSEPAVAGIVMQSLHHFDGVRYVLDVFTVMCNHIHVVLTPVMGSDGQPVALQGIMHSLKRHTAREANRVLGRTGQFWQHESYDHVVRDAAELARIRRYILNNPVRAGLVDDPRQWPYSWGSWWEEGR